MKQTVIHTSVTLARTFGAQVDASPLLMMCINWRIAVAKAIGRLVLSELLIVIVASLLGLTTPRMCTGAIL